MGPGRKEAGMPLFMDVHESLPEGASADDVAHAHKSDLEIQDQYGVRYLRYWVDDAAGKIFCLVEAPNAETASTVHKEAHGLVADHIYEVTEGS
jgi:Protein of unknown function (DUF4242)